MVTDVLCNHGRAVGLFAIFIQSRNRFATAFGLSLTSLSTQNRLQSLNTSISESSDLGDPLLIGGLAFEKRVT